MRLSKNYTFLMESIELISLFLLLKSKEKGLDKIQMRIMNRLEKILYDDLTIEEIENLDSLYSKIEKEKGQF